MIHVRRNFFCAVMILLLPVSLTAVDFGIVTGQYAGYGNDGENENYFLYQADVLPRLSFLIGDKSDLFISAGMSLGAEKGEFFCVPELLRTELTLRFGSFGIKAGRMRHADPLNFIVNGLFDGVKFYSISKAGTFSIGAWYTGFTYKKTANITMTIKEQALFDAVLDYGDFVNTYFAPRRLLVSLDWEHPSIAELFSLKAAVASQTDFSAADEKIHSQYYVIKAALPARNFLFELGGALETAQASAENYYKFTMAFAWDFGIFWTPPGKFKSRLSLTGRFAGGKIDEFYTAFIPVTTAYYSKIFLPKLSGLSILGLDYTARFNRYIGASITALHFVRNDLGTYSDYPAGEDSENYSLGTEFFARIFFGPFSDLQINLAGGVFLPALGNVGAKEKPAWRAELTAIFTLY